MNELSSAIIASHLQQGQVLIFDEIDSTNDYLLRHAKQLACGSICIANTQTAGRGRRGRNWYSPKGQNLYFSLLWHYKRSDFAENTPLAPLSLLVSLLIAESLQALGVHNVQIKWPNDIYLNGKKMGGILIESTMDHEKLSLVIGVGLNIAMVDADSTHISQAWADLRDYQLDRNQLLGTLTHALQQALVRYPSTGFAPYQIRWQSFDCFYQQVVRLITEQGEIHGIEQGITPNGELRLQQKEQLRHFAIGEISLRAES